MPGCRTPVAAAGAAARAPAVGYLQRQRVVLAGDTQLAAVRCGMLDHVGDRLLDDPVGSQVQPGGKLGPLATDVQVHSDASFGGSLHQAAAPPARPGRPYTRAAAAPNSRSPTQP